VDAAVATAAHNVLVHHFPAQQAALDADLTAALAAIPDGAAKTQGILLGEEAADGIIALRQGDGLGGDIGFVMPPPGQPGVWQLPPGVSPMTPWLSQFKPFLLESANQFRPGPPPDLTSEVWAADFNEVKYYGGTDTAAFPTLRTPEQTETARFWTTQPTAQALIGFRQLAQENDFDAAETARLLAMGPMVIADALTACWDAKYHYLFWRPLFAIPSELDDGNPDTVRVPGWTPAFGTPPQPEYPSAHGCATSAMSEVFVEALGTNKIDVEFTSTVGGVTLPPRRYARANDLVQEIIDARVWAGIHYRTSAVKGVVLGRKVAHFTLDRYFLPVD
jgi:hypothetical protein